MTPKIKALLDRATHPGTPIEEARSCAMIACKLIVALPPQPASVRATTYPDWSSIWEEVKHRESSRPKPPPPPPPRPTVEWRQIVAKYPSQCFYCRHTIRSGTSCQWAQGKGVAHINCYEDHK